MECDNCGSEVGLEKALAGRAGVHKAPRECPRCGADLRRGSSTTLKK